MQKTTELTRLVESELLKVECKEKAEKARAELVALEEENKRLWGLLSGWSDVGRGWHEANLMDSNVTDLYDRTTAILKKGGEDRIAQCQRRAIELVYGGECDNIIGAEVRQMLVDEFDEETVAALAEGGDNGR